MLRVATVDSDLALEELQQEGRKRMPVEEFLRGYRITSGERLG
jgi:methionyl-tRNA formyltransferase